MTEIERKIAERNGTMNNLYEEEVERLIRERYTIGAELALHRQKDTKPEEYAEYYAFVEECKRKAKKDFFEV